MKIILTDKDTKDLIEEAYKINDRYDYDCGVLPDFEIGCIVNGYIPKTINHKMVSMSNGCLYRLSDKKINSSMGYFLLYKWIKLENNRKIKIIERKIVEIFEDDIDKVEIRCYTNYILKDI